jgi:hypothetical protein
MIVLLVCDVLEMIFLIVESVRLGECVCVWMCKRVDGNGLLKEEGWPFVGRKRK